MSIFQFCFCLLLGYTLYLGAFNQGLLCDCETFVASSTDHRHISADFLPAAPGPEPVTTTEVAAKAPASADLFPTFSFPELGLAAEEEDSMAGYYAQHIQDINPFCGLVNIK